MYQWPARRLQIFGIHVHVGVRSPAKAISIGNALCAYIPHFLALSASSPYWVGEDTGLASVRSKVFEALPTAGLPYELEGWTEFEEFMGTLIAAKAITSIREVWWDIRPHPGFGTIELRICDGIPTLGRSVRSPRWRNAWWSGWTASSTGATPCRPLAPGYQGKQVAGRPVGPRGRDHRRRRRPGCSRSDPRSGTSSKSSARSPSGSGCTAELAGCGDILEHGASYARQREVMRRGGALVDVVEHLVEELRTDRPGPAPLERP